MEARFLGEHGYDGLPATVLLELLYLGRGGLWWSGEF